MPHPTIDPSIVQTDVSRALNEDIGSGDLSAALVPCDRQIVATIIAREPFVLCGRDWADACFRALDPQIELDWMAADGAAVSPDQVLVHIRGSARAILSAERCALNFLQTLSGTATVSAQYAALASASDTRILDTRKTLPGLRQAQKYAVRVGGCENHRMGLYDAVLIKENHISAAGSIAAAVAAARAGGNHMVEVEVESLAEFVQACDAGADRIMLDEFSDADLRQAIALSRDVELEISGSVDATRLKSLLEFGVDYISVGALTKHVRACDMSLRVIEPTSELRPGPTE